jgi:hypothetical protein
MAFSGIDAISHPPSQRQRAETRRWGRPSETPRTVGPMEQKERQLLLTLVAQLADAQFIRADKDRVDQLWQEVAALEIDPERVIRLLYGGQDLKDRTTLAMLDGGWHPEIPRGRRFPWGSRALRRGSSASGRRSVPPAALPARR